MGGIFPAVFEIQILLLLEEKPKKDLEKPKKMENPQKNSKKPKKPKKPIFQRLTPA